MSASVAHPGTSSRSGRSSRMIGVASAILAVILAIGFVMAGIDAPAPVITPTRGHPQVSDALQARRQLLREQAALNAQPTVNPNIVRAEQFEEFLANRAQEQSAARTLSPEIHRAQGYPEFLDSLTRGGTNVVNPELLGAKAYLDRLDAQGRQAMWEQRYADLVERFEGQANGGPGLTPLQGRF